MIQEVLYGHTVIDMKKKQILEARGTDGQADLFALDITPKQNIHRNDTQYT